MTPPQAAKIAIEAARQMILDLEKRIAELERRLK